jgi:hypothetical protein
MVGSASASGNQVYVGGPDGNLYSFNSDGTTNWIRPAGNVDSVYSTPSIASNDLIYIGSDEAEANHGGNPTTGLTAFNPSDGSTNFFFAPQDFYHGNGGDIDGNIMLGSDGTAYFLCRFIGWHPLCRAKRRPNWFLPDAPWLFDSLEPLDYAGRLGPVRL